MKKTLLVLASFVSLNAHAQSSARADYSKARAQRDAGANRYEQKERAQKAMEFDSRARATDATAIKEALSSSGYRADDFVNITRDLQPAGAQALGIINGFENREVYKAYYFKNSSKSFVCRADVTDFYSESEQGDQLMSNKTATVDCIPR